MRPTDQTKTSASPLVKAAIGVSLATGVSVAGAAYWIDGGGGAWPALGVAFAGILVTTLVVGRWLARRLRPPLVISRALQDYASGERDRAALLMAPDLGADARAWNELLEAAIGVRTGEAPVRAETFERLSASKYEVCDALWQGILIIGPDMLVGYCNGPAAALLGLGAQERVGLPLERIVEDEALSGIVRTVLNGEILARQTYELVRSEEGCSSVLRLGIRALPNRSNGALLVVEDVTQQRIADGARNAFVAQASHELRSPLTNMRLYLDALMGDSCAPEMRANALNVLGSELMRLDRIVSDMLSVAEIESGSLQVSHDDVRVDALLEDLGREFTHLAEEKGITLEVRLPPKLSTIQADRDKIGLTLHNILNNALKYTPEGGRVTVSAEERQGQLTIEVHDTGIGVSEQDLPHLFDRFYRAKDHRLADIVGSGLGLSIAQEIIHRHGGDIRVESTLDEGSTFSVRLPMQKQAA